MDTIIAATGVFVLLHVIAVGAFLAVYTANGGRISELRTAFRLGRRVERLAPRRRV